MAGHQQGKQQAVSAQGRALRPPLCCGFGPGYRPGVGGQPRIRCNRTLSSWLTQSRRVVASLPLAPRSPRDSGIEAGQGRWHPEARALRCLSSLESVSGAEREADVAAAAVIAAPEGSALTPSRRGSPGCSGSEEACLPETYLPRERQGKVTQRRWAPAGAWALPMPVFNLHRQEAGCSYWLK